MNTLKNYLNDPDLYVLNWEIRTCPPITITYTYNEGGICCSSAVIVRYVDTNMMNINY